MNKTDYLAKMENILSDNSKFKLANNQDIYKITDTQCTKFYPYVSRIGAMYGKPKVHKPGASLRLVYSAISTFTYDLLSTWQKSLPLLI